MSNDKDLSALLDALTKNISDEDLHLSMIQTEIAAKLISTRINLNKSQAEFAQMLGVSQGMISKWEQGETNFTLKTLVSISHKLALDLVVKLANPISREVVNCSYTTAGSNVIDINRYRASSVSVKYNEYSSYEELEEM